MGPPRKLIDRVRAWGCAKGVEPGANAECERLVVDRCHLLGRKVRRQHELEPFDVVAVPQHSVADARRPVHARPGLQAHAPLAFVLKLDPALEHVDELEPGAIQMRLARKLGAGAGADHMRRKAPMRRLSRRDARSCRTNAAHSDYIVFVDESGDHSLESVNPDCPIFVLAFCILPTAVYVEQITPAVRRLKC
jgi:hypothetical protein